MGNIFRLIYILVITFPIFGCALFIENKEDTWYPEYSLHFAARKNPIVYIHGYGGGVGTFQQLAIELSDQMNRGMYYFLYDSGPLREESAHISDLASDLRAFLYNNVFDHNPDARVDIVVHSTGGLVAREYVINNPLDHRVNKIALVGVPNYGAYFASVKDAVFYQGIFSGDLQAKELQHGSTMLFELQRRWDCYYKIYKSLNADGSLPITSLLPNCVQHSKILPNDKSPEPSDSNGKIEFPKILSIIGTSYWDDSMAFRFSDLTVRLESGVLDERFLEKIKETNKPELPAVIYVKYDHLESFFGDGYFGSDESRQEISHILSKFLSVPKPKENTNTPSPPPKDDLSFPCSTKESFYDLLECYTDIRNDELDYVGKYPGIGRDKDVDVAAYWIRVTDLSEDCRADLRNADPKVIFNVTEKKDDKTSIDVKLDRPLLETLTQDWTKRTKIMFNKGSWIRYQRYVSLGKKEEMETEVTVTLTPRKRSAEYPTELEEDTNLSPIHIKTTMKLVRGRTTMLHCWASEENCIDITGRGDSEDYPKKLSKESSIDNKGNNCKGPNKPLFEKMGNERASLLLTNTSHFTPTLLSLTS